MVALMGASITVANSASFDCAKASSRIETTICGSPRVSNLDEELASEYQKALSRAPDAGGAKDEVRSAQRAWLRGSRDACSDAICLEKAYSQRVAILKAARAQFDEAKATAEQEEKAPPPGPELTAQSTPPGLASATAPTPIASAPVEASQAPTSTGTATGQASTATEPVVSTSGPSTSVAPLAAGKFPERDVGPRVTVQTALFVAAILQLPVSFWLIFRKVRGVKGTVQATVIGLVGSLGVLVALALGAATLGGDDVRVQQVEKAQSMTLATQSAPLLVAPRSTAPTKSETSVPPIFPSLAGLRFGMRASELPSGYQKVSTAGRNEEQHQQLLDLTGLRRTTCYEKAGGDSGLTGISIEKTLACFDTEKDTLVRANTILPKDTNASPLLLDIKRRVDDVVKAEGTAESDNGKWGYAKYQWRTTVGGEQVEIGFWSVPSFTQVLQDASAIYRDGKARPLPGR